jgi:hypothetical protein
MLGFGPPKKESWEYTEEEKIEEANKLKEEGTKEFKAANFKEVIRFFFTPLFNYTTLI